MVQQKQTRWQRFLRSVWIFPFLLTILLIVATSLKLNGSSVGGMYHKAFFGNSPDSSLLLNHAQPIRSDEWLVTTQLTIAQHAAGYPRFNSNIDSGRDMSVVGDAPNKDWSTFFRPQNLSFLVLPFEYAFAFKWWFLLYMLIISSYFLTLRVFKDRRLLAAVLSLAFSLSPFVFWWYATGTLATLFYGFFIILLSFRVINNEPVILLKNKPRYYSQVLYAVTLGYLLTAFALVLYPPFQISIAIAATFVVLGLFIGKFAGKKPFEFKPILRVLGVFAAGIVIATVAVLMFFHTRSNVVSAITNSAYPGNRKVSFQGNSAYELTSTYMMPQLQRISRAANYYTNQSEASNFILFLPYLFIPGLILLIKQYTQKRTINWPLLTTQVGIGLFLLYLFVPVFHAFYHLIFLDKVANSRLFIGLGFMGFIQLLLVSKTIERLDLKRRFLLWFASINTFVAIIAMVWAGIYTRSTYPKFMHSWELIGLLILFFSTMLFCFLSGRRIVGAFLLLIFSAGSVFHVHPLYRGLGPVYQGAVTQAIDKISKPGDTWVTMDSLFYENFALIAGRDSLSGIKPYPSLTYWQKIAGKQNQYIYNRYAHVLFNSDPNFTSNLLLTGPDSFQVRFACTPLVENNIKFALTAHALNLPCVTELKEVKYPAITFYLYKVSR